MNSSEISEPPGLDGADEMRREGQAGAKAAPVEGAPAQPLALRGSALSLAAVALALLFISIAASGSGGFGNFLLDPIHRAAAISLTLLAALTPMCGCNIGLGIETDRANDWVLFALLIGGLSLGWASAFCDRHNFWTIGDERVRCLGLGLFLLGSALRIASILTLAGQFSVWVSIQDDHKLVTDKLYRFVRHPSYTGAILTLVGWALVCRSGIGVLIALMMSALLISRINAEEGILLRAFPVEYAEYARRAWRLIPFVY